ncbi:MAG: NAD(P)-dependent oxidoreductase, partial [Rhodospirillales bacterium]
MSQRIAFLGLGLMGGPMAENLIAAGQDVTVWNRTVSKTDALVALGARAELTPPEAVADADLVIVMLENGPVVQSVLFDSGVSDVIPSGAVVIDMSSIPPGMAKDHAERLAKVGVGH